MRAAPVMGLLLVASTFLAPPEQVAADGRDVGPAVASSLPDEMPALLTSTSPPLLVEPEFIPPVPPPTVPEIIEAAALEFHQDPVLLTRVAFCESSHRVDVIGDGGLAVGLFQFHPDTWREESKFLDYHEDLRSDPVASSRVAAFMFSQGLQHRWTCYGTVLARGYP